MYRFIKQTIRVKRKMPPLRHFSQTEDKVRGYTSLGLNYFMNKKVPKALYFLAFRHFLWYNRYIKFERYFHHDDTKSR